MYFPKWAHFIYVSSPRPSIRLLHSGAVTNDWKWMCNRSSAGGARTDIGIISHTYRPAYYYYYISAPTHPPNMEKTSLHPLGEHVNVIVGFPKAFFFNFGHMCMKFTWALRADPSLIVICCINLVLKTPTVQCFHTSCCIAWGVAMNSLVSREERLKFIIHVN